MSPLRVLVLFVLPILGFQSAGCIRPPLPEVHLVIPNDYLGIIQIVVHPFDGVDVRPEGNKRTYVIPKHGVLQVKNHLPPEGKMRVTAEYSEGTPIKVAYRLKMYKEGTICVYGPYYNDPSKTYMFLVGTDKEIQQGIDSWKR
jgi:hypothetical protein